MAFTETQRVSIRTYLGYPDILRYKDVRLESVLDIIGERPEAQAAVEAILTKLDTLETDEIAKALKTAGLRQAEDVGWFQGTDASGSAALQARYAEGRRLVSRLSIIMGVPIYGDVFGRQGYPGDAFTGFSHQYGGPIMRG